eukprot:Gb_28488 [translate_table: standard]
MIIIHPSRYIFEQHPHEDRVWENLLKILSNAGFNLFIQNVCWFHHLQPIDHLILEFVKKFKVNEAISSVQGYTISVNETAIANATGLPSEGLEVGFWDARVKKLQTGMGVNLRYSSWCSENLATVGIIGKRASLVFNVNTKDKARKYMAALVMQHLSGINRTTCNVQQYMDSIDGLFAGINTNWPKHISQKMVHVFSSLQRRAQIFVPYASVIAMLLMDQAPELIKGKQIVENSVQEEPLRNIDIQAADELLETEKGKGREDRYMQGVGETIAILAERTLEIAEQRLQDAVTCKEFSVQHPSWEESLKHNVNDEKIARNQIQHMVQTPSKHTECEQQQCQDQLGAQKRKQGMLHSEEPLVKKIRNSLPENCLQGIMMTGGEASSSHISVSDSQSLEMEHIQQSVVAAMDALDCHKQRDGQLKCLQEQLYQAKAEIKGLVEKNKILSEQVQKMKESLDDHKQKTDLLKDLEVHFSQTKNELKTMVDENDKLSKELKETKQKLNKKEAAWKKFNEEFTNAEQTKEAIQMPKMENNSSVQITLDRTADFQQRPEDITSLEGSLKTLKQQVEDMHKLLKQQKTEDTMQQHVEHLMHKWMQQRPSGERESAKQVSNNDDAFNCSICMEPWTQDGEHRICSLACGHYFGRSCIRRWLEQSRAKDSRKCPHCFRKAKLRDIRTHYVQQIAVTDGEIQQS